MPNDVDVLPNDIDKLKDIIFKHQSRIIDLDTPESEGNELKKLNLDDREVADLIAFLYALNQPLKIERPSPVK